MRLLAAVLAPPHLRHCSWFSSLTISPPPYHWPCRNNSSLLCRHSRLRRRHCLHGGKKRIVTITGVWWQNKSLLYGSRWSLIGCACSAVLCVCCVTMSPMSFTASSQTVLVFVMCDSASLHIYFIIIYCYDADTLQGPSCVPALPSLLASRHLRHCSCYPSPITEHVRMTRLRFTGIHEYADGIAYTDSIKRCVVTTFIIAPLF